MERDFDFFRTFKFVKKFTIMFFTIALILFTALSWLVINLIGVNLIFAYIPTVGLSGFYIYWMMQLEDLTNEVTRSLMDDKYPELREWDNPWEEEYEDLRKADKQNKQYICKIRNEIERILIEAIASLA